MKGAAQSGDVAAAPSPGVTGRRLDRLREGAWTAGEDAVAVEEPLEIRVAGDAVAVTMRTPGHDRELALGFLYGEGVITGLADVGTVAHCGRPGEEGFGNVIDVRPGPGVALDPERMLPARRGTLTTAACGVCGRRSIADLRERCGVLAAATAADAVPLAVVADAMARLREGQREFSRTGGTHAAVALSLEGAVMARAEDIGRHNAVDKVVGRLLLDGMLAGAAHGAAGAAVLAVSGRASFEIVQKAAAARIGVVASVSAASSLAIDLAQETGVCLLAFVREGTMNLYTHAARIAR